MNRGGTERGSPVVGPVATYPVTYRGPFSEPALVRIIHAFVGPEPRSQIEFSQLSAMIIANERLCSSGNGLGDLVQAYVNNPG